MAATLHGLLEGDEPTAALATPVERLNPGAVPDALRRLLAEIDACRRAGTRSSPGLGAARAAACVVLTAACVERGQHVALPAAF